MNSLNFLFVSQLFIFVVYFAPHIQPLSAQACDPNCAKCDVNGPSYCDAYTCAPGYFYNLATNSCAACLPNCARCSDMTTCDQCNDGFLYNGSCIIDCNVTSCKSCSAVNICTQCKPTFLLQSSAICTACISNCKSCTSGTSCTQCVDNYYFNGTSCNPCIPNCLSCSNAVPCSQCAEGFYYNGTACIACQSNCAKCTLNPSGCDVCKAGFVYVNSTAALCQACGANCNYCAKNGKGNCDSSFCSTGYVYFNKTCAACDVNCLSCNTNGRWKCDPGFCKANYAYNNTNMMCSMINNCLSSPCQNGGTCTPYVGKYNCTCQYGTNGTNCETVINNCASSPCLNGATCTSSLGQYNCTCPYGYNGTRCDTVINYCSSSPCQNGAVCNLLVGQYNCTCPIGTTGVNCQTMINYCSSSPCQYSGTCNQLFGQYNCTCPYGTTGVNCQTAINYCQSQPCQNGATCNQQFGKYTCTCQSGYTDFNCQTLITTKTVPVVLDFKVGSFLWSDNLDVNTSTEFRNYESQICNGPMKNIFANANVTNKVYQPSSCKVIKFRKGSVYATTASIFVASISDTTPDATFTQSLQSTMATYVQSNPSDSLGIAPDSLKVTVAPSDGSTVNPCNYANCDQGCSLTSANTPQCSCYAGYILTGATTCQPLTKTVSVGFEFKVGSFKWSDDLNNNSSDTFKGYQSELCDKLVKNFFAMYNVSNRVYQPSSCKAIKFRQGSVYSTISVILVTSSSDTTSDFNFFVNLQAAFTTFVQQYYPNLGISADSFRAFILTIAGRCSTANCDQYCTETSDDYLCSCSNGYALYGKTKCRSTANQSSLGFSIGVPLVVIAGVIILTAITAYSLINSKNAVKTKQRPLRQQYHMPGVNQPRFKQWIPYNRYY